MKVHITFSENKKTPVVILEPENETENGELELLASFDSASFRIVINEEADA